MPQRIESAAFSPTEAAATRRPWLTARRIAALLALAAAAAAAWILWFLFTAKSVRFETDPPAAAVTVEGGLGIRLADTHLLRAGSYRVRAVLAGHHDAERDVTVGSARNQVVSIPLQRLPGRVAFDVRPPGAAVHLAGASEPLGTAPLEVRLPAGTSTVRISAERYRPRDVAFAVAGMERAQTVSVALDPNWAEVAIPTRPPGAAVHVDGIATGYATPGPVPILEGERRVAVLLPGYDPWNDILDVAAGTQVQLPPIALSRAGGRLAVDSTPTGASITVDGVYRGTTPLAVDVAPDRPLAVRAFKVGHADAERTVSVASGARRVLDFALEPLAGQVAIETQPPDARLWIDGRQHGAAAGVVSLPAVPHEIEIRKDGYAAYKKTLTPRPGFTQSLKVRLLTLEEARMEALRRVRTTSEGHELVLLSPGAIRMGASRREPGRRSNEVLRDVTLTRLFYLGRHEVTNAQFRAFAPGHASGAFQNISLNGADQPATGISWQEAALYCNWLSEKDGLAPFYRVEYGKVVGVDAAALGYRLPTEAEWAWSARSTQDGPPLRYAWGGRLPPPERHGNYADRSAAHLVARIIIDYNDNHIASAPVGVFPANAKGIHDLGGNVAEWTHDFYAIPDAAAAEDPLGPESGEYHVIRGASWQKGAITDLRLSFRDYGIDGRADLGFRIARFAE